jgi:hypothetical protein
MFSELGNNFNPVRSIRRNLIKSFIALHRFMLKGVGRGYVESRSVKEAELRGL